MLSYRHGFHAGNAADVLKHAILVFCLEYLLQKEKPLLCVDTHAGAGLYRLSEGFAARTGEWKNGVGKMPRSFRDGPAMLRRYLEACASSEPGTYVGSPLIMARLLEKRLFRAADRLVCFELHGADYEACKAALGHRAEIRRADGFEGLKGLLPPPSRRGLVLVDPPYEVKDDYTRVARAASLILKRFSSCLCIFWYPLFRKPPPGCAELPDRLLSLYRGNRCRIELRAEASEILAGNPGDVPPAHSPRGMYGSGLVIYNPPWTLRAALDEALPALALALGTGAESWNVAFGEEPFLFSRNLL